MIGIDLGTTNSLVCVWEESGVRLIKNRFGDVLTPSIVSFDSDGTIYVGKTAKERLVTHPETTFREFKRDMGTDVKFKAYDQTYTPEELSALVLKQLKGDAEFELGHPVEEAVISVPAYFDDKQRAATRNAGLLAGLKVERLINEPSAAALSYHIEHYDEDEMFVVFDFGGGTLDVSLVDSFDNIIEIQAISGNNKLGGKDFNTLIAYDICARNNIFWDKLSSQTKEILLREAEQVKIKLTDEDKVSAVIRIDGKDYSYKLDNQQLINLSEKLFTGIQKVLTRMMNERMITPEDISRVIMVGGSSKMPVVRQFISRLFQGRISDSGNPDEIVCLGTGVVCGIKQRKDKIKDIVISDICPFTLGVGIVGDIMSPIISRNQVLPCSNMHFFTTVEDNQEKILFEVYQGEDRTASKNLSLAEIELFVPPKPRGQVKVTVRFSYDINGLFDIDVDCLDTGEHIHRELHNFGRMTETEIKNRKAVLEKMKIHPREMERNKCLLERANALYIECNIEQQAFLSRAIDHFEEALNRLSPVAMERAYRTFTVQLSMLEASMFSSHAFDKQQWEKTFEDDYDEEECDEDAGE